MLVYKEPSKSNTARTRFTDEDKRLTLATSFLPIVTSVKKFVASWGHEQAPRDTSHN